VVACVVVEVKVQQRRPDGGSIPPIARIVFFLLFFLLYLWLFCLLLCSALVASSMIGGWVCGVLTEYETSMEYAWVHVKLVYLFLMLRQRCLVEHVESRALCVHQRKVLKGARSRQMGDTIEKRYNKTRDKV
jgi:hypothetical protein